MAPPKKTTAASPAPPVASSSGSRNRTAEALYEWCRKNHDLGYVFTQDELLDAGIVPDRDMAILLSSTQHLVNTALFKLHDRAGGTIGWELVDQEKAKKYTVLPLKKSVSVLTQMSTATQAFPSMRNSFTPSSMPLDLLEYGPEPSRPALCSTSSC